MNFASIERAYTYEDCVSVCLSVCDSEYAHLDAKVVRLQH